MRRLLTILAFLILLVPVLSQDEAERSYDRQELSKLNTMKSFDYDRDIPPPDNLLLDLLAGIARLFFWLFSNVFGYIILIGLLVLLIWIILKNTSLSKSGLSHKENPEHAVIINTKEELVLTDFDLMIREALANNDFRLAIRFSFLKALQILEKTERIAWKKEKTNHDYLSELESKDRSSYDRLLLVYEYTWYGEFPASEPLYDSITGQVGAIERGGMNE